MTKIVITKIIIRSRIPYLIPARYSSYSKAIVSINGENKHEIDVQTYRTFNRVVEAVKKRYGNGIEYVIDKEKPYVHYI